MPHRPSRLFPVAAVLAFAAFAHAADGSGRDAPRSRIAQAAPSQVEAVVQDEVAVRGIVVAIDVEARRLTLDTASGTRSLPVAPDVPGLAGLEKGDVVDVHYHRSVLFDIQPAGSAEPGAYISESGRPVGGSGAVGEQQVTVLATVIEVDAGAGTFTVQGPSGNVRQLRADTPEHRAAVARIRVGDLLRVRFREGIAVSLAPVEMH